MSRYYDDVLCHHGRKGMHWGILNGPPYPLGAEGNAKFKKNAKKFADGAAAGAKKVGHATATVAKATGRGVKKVASVAKDRYDAGVPKREAKKQAKDAKKYEKRIAKIADNPDKAYQNRKKYTAKEMQDIANRIRLNASVKEATTSPTKEAIKMVKTAIDYGTTLNNAYTMASNLFGNYNKLRNGSLSMEKQREKEAHEKMYKETNAKILEAARNPGGMTAKERKEVQRKARSFTAKEAQQTQQNLQNLNKIDNAIDPRKKKGGKNS